MVETNGMVYERCLSRRWWRWSPPSRRWRSLDLVRPSDIDPYPVARYKDSVLGDALDDFIREDNVKTVTNSRDIIVIQILEYQPCRSDPNSSTA